jgi:Spy/CpxP family protein refolding chaperone
LAVGFNIIKKGGVMQKRFVVMMVLVCFVLLAGYGYAFEHGKGKGGHGGFEEQFCHKAMLIIKNQEELGLTDEQVKKIKDLKVSTKKDLIRKNAEIDILALDIKAAMWEDVIDTNAVNALIDKKYELKKENAKSLVAAYVALKTILTEEQQKKLKAICGKDKR